MPTPLIDFESNFRTADTLLKVYRLLETPNGPQTAHALMQRIRELLMAQDDEELILLQSELFLGVVRERADVRPTVFRRDSLSMLLRQAAVAAMSAIDVYYPALLRARLPGIIMIKQHNFIRVSKNSLDFMKGFHLALDGCLRMISDEKPAEVLGDLIVKYIMKEKTFSNLQGVEVALEFLGIEDPWAKIAARLGTTKEPLSKQFNSLVSRRNGIVHHGDRDPKDPAGDVQDITYAWTLSHIQIAHSVVQASDELVRASMQALGLPAIAEQNG